jgi:hypothetical protein
MSDRKRVTSDPKQGESAMSNSIAAEEAFEFLNAGTRQFYRGQGDTPTAARDRAARAAGITTAQAERVWKRWRDMKAPNGDVYRLLRNAYGHLCTSIENKADAIAAERQAIEAFNETVTRPVAASVGMARAAQGAASRAGEAEE